MFALNAGANYNQWQGQCTACSEWNVLKEFKVPSSSSTPSMPSSAKGYSGESLNKVQNINDVKLGGSCQNTFKARRAE